MKAKTVKKKPLTPVTIIVTLIFVLYLLILLVPYVYALFASLSNYKEYYFNLFPIPKEGLKFINYLEAWTSLSHEGTGVPQMILNSLWFAGVPAVLGVFLSSCGAYICAKSYLITMCSLLPLPEMIQQAVQIIFAIATKCGLHRW